MLIEPVRRCVGCSRNSFDLRAIINVRSTQELLDALRIIEAPLSVVVLNAQIAAGLWRRNGWAIRDQSFHYVGVTLRDRTYAFDLLVLQAMACLIQPDHFLRLVVEQFDLAEYFSPAPRAPFDHDQTLYLAEECLHFIIGAWPRGGRAAGRMCRPRADVCGAPLCCAIGPRNSMKRW